MTATATNDRDRAAHLRGLAAAWAADLRRMGRRPRRLRMLNRRTFRERCRPWDHLQAAIAGAVELADALENNDVQTTAPLEVRAVELRRTGLTLVAVGTMLGVPHRTVQTWCRRHGLAGVTPCQQPA